MKSFSTFLILRESVKDPHTKLHEMRVSMLKIGPTLHLAEGDSSAALAQANILFPHFRHRLAVGESQPQRRGDPIGDFPLPPVLTLGDPSHETP